MTGQLRVILPLLWLGGAITAWGAIHSLLSTTPRLFDIGPGWFLMLLVLAIISELKPVPFTLGRAAHKDESLTITIILLTLYTFDWPTALLLAVLAVIVADLASNKPYYKLLFNASMYAISTGAAAIAFAVVTAQLQHLHPAFPPVWRTIFAQLAAGVAYYVMNLTLLMLVLSRIDRIRLAQMVAWGFRDSAQVNLTLIAISVVMAQLWLIHPSAAAILVPPLFMVKLGYERYTHLRTEAESMLAALADVIDMRDDTTGNHSLRVSEMSYGVARMLNVPEEQALMIKAVARVHDVGKIVVRDGVLLKAAELTARERAEMEAHVEAGRRILSHLSVLRPHLATLAEHHERLDGRGYPLGLKSDDIGLGGRILAACDAYDTITSDRPHRAHKPHEVAMTELYRHVETQFDPKVVRALETWLIREQRLRPDWRAVFEKTRPDEDGGIVLHLDASKPTGGGNGDYTEPAGRERRTAPRGTGGSAT